MCFVDVAASYGNNINGFCSGSKCFARKSRGVILKRKNITQSRSSRPGTAKEGPAEIREHYLHFPNHRPFTPGQKIVLESVNKTPFSTDKVTVFSIRPPELLFVNKLKLYYRWF